MMSFVLAEWREWSGWITASASATSVKTDVIIIINVIIEPQFP